MKHHHDISILASATLFKKLNDTKHDVYDILSAFIKASIARNGRHIYSLTEIRDQVCEEFDYDIPEGAFKVAIKKKLSPHFLQIGQAKYTVVGEIDPDFEKMGENEEERIKNLIERLDLYIGSHKKIRVNINKKEIFDSLQCFLIGRTVENEKVKSIISAFILDHANDPEIIELLNSVKEGLILYTGIRHSISSTNAHNSIWRQNLTIYLDMDVLFDLVGYSGEVFKRMAKDLFGYIGEINRAVKQGQQKPIKLRYFKSVENQIYNFFHAAEQIVTKRQAVVGGRKAMATIVNGCKTGGDVLQEKARFFTSIQNMGIALHEEVGCTACPEYNLVSEKTIKEIQKANMHAGRKFERDKCIEILTQISEINRLRHGKSDCGFDQIEHIILTQSGMMKYVSYSGQYKESENDVPFATDLNFLTNRFWFKLNKGFGGENPLPESFNVLTIAKTIISSQLREKVEKEYERLREKRARGELDNQTLEHMIIDIRSRTYIQDEDDVKSYSDALEFLTIDGLERAEQQLAETQKKITEGDMAKKELTEYKRKEINRIKNSIKSKAKIKYLNRLVLGFGGYVAFIILLILFIVMFREPSDTIIGIVALLVTVCFGCWEIIKKQSIKKWAKRNANIYYKANVSVAYKL